MTIYGNKRDYPKIDIHINGVYVCSTTWSRNVKEAKSKFIETHPTVIELCVVTAFYA